MLQHLAALEVAHALPWLHKTPGHDHEKPNRFELRRGMGLVPVRARVLPPATHTNCIVWGEDELYVIDPGADDPQEQAHLIGSTRTRTRRARTPSASTARWPMAM